MEKTPEVVNTIIAIATVLFFSLIALELIYAKKTKMKLYTWKESFNTLSIGIVHRMITLLVPFAYKVFFLNFGYSYALYKFESGVVHFIFAYILTDFFYYVQHRCNHYFDFLWSFHEVHHSSQELNLLTAIRVSWIMPIVGALFLTPITLLGVDPDYIIISLVLIFYGQWWCHTQAINKIPFIEGILNTPAGHRLHHSPVSGECNSNYAGTLMIWDRLFGTYIEEETKKTSSFGISDGFVGQNPIKINFRGIINYWKQRVSPKRSKIIFISLTIILVVLSGKYILDLRYQEPESRSTVTALQIHKSYQAQGLNYLELINPAARYKETVFALRSRFEAQDSTTSNFVLNHKKFQEHYRAFDFRQGKINQYLYLVLNKYNFNFTGKSTNIKSFGELDHPMQTELQQNLQFYDRSFSRLGNYYESEFFNSAFQRELDTKTNYELTRGNKIIILENSESFEKVMDIFNQADKFILIQMLGFACEGKSVEALISTLNEKIKSGVKVKLLVDNVFGKLSFGCLSQVEEMGVEVIRIVSSKGMLKPIHHSSVIMNEKSQMVIGAQSFYWGFYESNGIDFLDRDTSLYIEGPTTTDALRELLSIYAKFTPSKTDLPELINILKTSEKKQTLNKNRGNHLYTSWFKTQEPGLCRFAGQRPWGESRGLENLLRAYSMASKHSVSLSSVKFLQDNKDGTGRAAKLMDKLIERSSKGLRLELFGNGVIGGNGELTIELHRLFKKSEKQNNQNPSWFEQIKMGIYKKLERSAYFNHAKINYATYDSLLRNRNITIWANSNFTHHKTWDFDHQAFGVGSFLLSERSFERFYEAGVICLDKKAQTQFSKGRVLDMINSSPYFKRN
jgi:sterol desaturase/sphingolipid hydroxylase (fatty acid hydroxylase superfamily)